MQYLAYLAIGLAAGVLGGFFGVGGGIILIPGLVMLLGYDQLRAQGTSLGILLLPIGIMGFLQYWKNPAVHIDLWAVAYIALAFAVGANFGGKWANHLDMLVMRKAFAIFVVIMGTYMYFRR
jgi:uncharacterized membrane protein YfcA